MLRAGGDHAIGINRAHPEALSEEHLRPIGLVASQFAWTEVLWDGAIWKLLGMTSKKGRAVTSLLGATSKLHLISTLAQNRPRLKSGLQHLIKEGDELRRRRNLILHSYFVGPWPDAPFGQLVSYSAYGKLIDRSRMVPAGRIEQIAQRIAKYNAFLMEFHDLLPRQRGGRIPKLKKPLTIAQMIRLLPPELEP
jgi:hypothetical protein